MPPCKRVDSYVPVCYNHNMKIKKVLNKKSLVVGLALLSLVLSVLAVRAEMNSRDLSSVVNSQSEQISTLSKRISDYTYSPHSLNECLNTAATEYTTFVKSNGKISVIGGGEPSYQLTEAQWKTADVKLANERNNCEVLFGRKS